MYTYSLDVYADDGAVQKWLRTWRALPTGANNLKRTAHHTLQIDLETGVGLEGYSVYETVLLLAENGDFLMTEQGGEITAGPPWTVASSNNSTYTVTATVLDSGGTAYTVVNAVDTSNGAAYLPLGSNTGDYILVERQTVVGAEPRMMLRWSDDGGHTWTSERTTGMGRIGQYGYRALFRRLGMTTKIRDRVYEISGTDPVKVAIMGAELELSGTNA